jgi:hypothetical protein
MPTTLSTPTTPSVPSALTESSAGLWDILSSIGTIAAVLVALAFGLWSIRQATAAGRAAAADQRRLFELGILRELLDSIPSDASDRAEAEQNIHNQVEVITDRHYTLLSLLPNDMLPYFRELAVAMGRNELEKVPDICNRAGVPPLFSPRQRVRRLQRRELLEACAIRSGGDRDEVSRWLDQLDGRARM